MSIRNEVGSWIIVTIVAMLIWLYAAGATVQSRKITAVSIVFERGDSTAWSVRQEQVRFDVTVEGSALAIQNAERELAHAVTVELGEAEGEGEIDVDVAELLRTHDPLLLTGVDVVDATPAVVRLHVDELTTLTARVRRQLPGVVDDIVIEPAEVSLRLPRRVADMLGNAPYVDLDPSIVDDLEPGVPNDVDDVGLRLPDVLIPYVELIELEPSTVSVQLTVRSRMSDLTLDAIRVQVAGPHEDWDEYVVELTPKQLREVVLRGDSAIVDRIEAGEINQVFAILHLSSGEKESALESKPISYFVAFPPEGGVHVLEFVRAADSTQMPVIQLQIDRIVAPE